jgi:hypothetical protein
MFCNERKRIMLYRAVPLFLVALALTLFAGTPVLADDAKKASGDKAAIKSDTHEGTVVRVTADTFVMKGKAKNGEVAKEYTYTLADKAKVTCDGKVCLVKDLKPDQKIRVTTKKGDKEIAIIVEALDKNEKFETVNVKGKGPDKN